MRLTPSLSWCECEGMILLLDLAADRYFRLAPRLEPSFRRYVAGRHRDADEARLVAAGLTLAEPRPDCEPLSRPPDGDVPLAARAPLAGVARTLCAEAGAAWRLAHSGLGRTLLAPPKPRPASRPEAEIASEIAACFARTGLLLGVSGRCLTRAIACRALCAARGCAATLVLGVRGAPFQAHAWVERDGLVLVGDCDQVRAYTPILALA